MDKRHARHAEMIFLFNFSSVYIKKRHDFAETISDYSTAAEDFNMKMIFKFIFLLFFPDLFCFCISLREGVRKRESRSKRGTEVI